MTAQYLLPKRSFLDGSIRVLQSELAAEEAGLAAKQAEAAEARASTARAVQQHKVAQRKLQLELAKSDARSQRSRSRFNLPGLGSPIQHIIADAVPGGSPQPATGAMPSWMSMDLERELSALIGRDADEARAQGEALERAKLAYITEERAKHLNLETLFKSEHEQRLVSYHAEFQQSEGIALNRLEAELQTAEAAHAEQFQAAVVL